jgi:hypothetical protein|tara:strand:- start:435 stop:1214 length:780 start_codon:yes stop_codon:yes gene_type:complete
MSCLPSSWDNTKRKVESNTNSQRRQKRTRHDFSTKSHLETVHAALSKHLNKAPDDLSSKQLDFDPLLESIPFVKMLHSVIPPSDDMPDVLIATRSYEESFLRECVSDKEQQCVMGTQCECMMIDSSQPFVGVRFLLPNALHVQDDEFESNENVIQDEECESKSETSGMCLLCLRKVTQILFYQSIHRGIHMNGLIQKHGNICNQPGEYHANAMLICPPHGPVQSMPLPMVAHQRSNYVVNKRQGVHWITQKNVAFEDFQ